eukprot:scaffold44312_cov45-Phaeocystis_antarctica.AAC.4
MSAARGARVGGENEGGGESGREWGWGQQRGGECERAGRVGACTDKGRVDEFIAQPDGLEDLRAVVRREQRDADLGENLEPVRLERLAHLRRGGCEVGGDRIGGEKEDKGAGAGAAVGVCA